MKSYIEEKRSLNEFGTLTWQLGEVWPTGGWGSLEYGIIIKLFTESYYLLASPENGQVIGGRWKPLHYWLASTLFTDVIATCGVGGTCYIKNDGITPFTGKIEISAVNLLSGNSQIALSKEVKLSAGAGSIEWFCVYPARLLINPPPPPHRFFEEI